MTYLNCSPDHIIVFIGESVVTAAKLMHTEPPNKVFNRVSYWTLRAINSDLF